MHAAYRKVPPLSSRHRGTDMGWFSMGSPEMARNTSSAESGDAVA